MPGLQWEVHQYHNPNIMHESAIVMVNTSILRDHAHDAITNEQ
jgi:hypothetical protein